MLRHSKIVEIPQRLQPEKEQKVTISDLVRFGTVRSEIEILSSNQAAFKAEMKAESDTKSGAR